MSTVLVQIEASLNSRPLFALSSSPNDLEPLTPGHFLIGRPLTSLPEKNFLEVKSTAVSRFQLLQRLHQSFWKRWSTEYITELQTKTKWKIKTSPISEGTLVLVKEDNLPPSKWLLGRVVKVHSGRDSVNRVVEIKTVSGIIKRPVTKICVLPLPEET